MEIENIYVCISIFYSMLHSTHVISVITSLEMQL